jgi:hypothetical protein
MARNEKQHLENHYLKEFLGSKCDLFDSKDWHFYAEKTGKSIDWLQENASFYSDDGILGTCLKNAIADNDFEMAEMFI